MSLSSRSSCIGSRHAGSQQLTQHRATLCFLPLCLTPTPHFPPITLNNKWNQNKARLHPTPQAPSRCFCWCFPFLRALFPFNKWQSHIACKNSYCHCKDYAQQSLFGVCFGGVFGLGEIFFSISIWPSACCRIIFLMNSLSDGNSVYLGICFSCFQLPSSRDKILREHGAKQKDLTTKESTFKETVLLYAICEELPDWATATSTSKHFPQGRHLLTDTTTN